jgi:hypothetical protein
LKLTQLNINNSTANTAGVRERTTASLSVARREEARAAEESKWDNVRFIARRFRFVSTLLFVVGVSNSTSVDCDTSRESIFNANGGMIPDGKEEEREMGSSLHSGHISDPLP